ncbi:hypothetical protein Agabi119p4_6158 [Agaricus bisporus var. burnettii]|uniref:Uncharacterized protein n=1 Tax=Agaricus bisporus var. burnettii TaxID=192524 RepID=A0A8H7F1C0_AGABI|nr:hypothetical protein Agabi119p4_11561 [Agaricus bisporus var. burnettii]KAF7771847.1 hypothetical protein Agabi119p4_6158 [Agaricus bisporus var. burnettii]
MSSKGSYAPRPLQLDSDPYLVAAEVHRRERSTLYAFLCGQSPNGKGKSKAKSSAHHQAHRGTTISQTGSEVALRQSRHSDVRSNDSFDLLLDTDSIMSDAPVIHSTGTFSTTRDDFDAVDEDMPLVELGQLIDEAMPLFEVEPMEESNPPMEVEELKPMVGNVSILPLWASPQGKNRKMSIDVNTDDSQSRQPPSHCTPTNLNHPPPRSGTSERRRSPPSDSEPEERSASSKRRRSSLSDNETEERSASTKRRRSEAEERRVSTKRRLSSLSGNETEEQSASTKRRRSEAEEQRVGTKRRLSSLSGNETEEQSASTKRRHPSFSDSAAEEQSVLQSLVDNTPNKRARVGRHNLTITYVDGNGAIPTPGEPRIPNGPIRPTALTNSWMNTGSEYQSEGEALKSQAGASALSEHNKLWPSQGSNLPMLPLRQAPRLNTSHVNVVDASNHSNHPHGHVTPGAPSVPECQAYPTAVNDINLPRLYDWLASGVRLGILSGQNPAIPGNSNQNAADSGNLGWHNPVILGDFHHDWLHSQGVSFPSGGGVEAPSVDPIYDDGDADDERDLPNYHGNGKYPNHNPKNCEQEYSLFKKRVRDALRSLLGYRKGTTKLVSASRDECETFARTGRFRDGPSLDQFRLDFVSNLKSPWNRRAADIFMEHWADTEGDDFEAKRAVEDSFWVTFKTLKRIYAQERTPSPNIIARELKRKATNANGRRYNRRQRRANACYYYEDLSPELAKYAELWKRLSPDACSGDEEIALPSGETAHVIIEPHGAANVSENGLGYLTLYIWTQINPPRVDETSRAVKQLPRNFYDDQWYNNLNDLERSHIDAQPEVSLAFNPELMKTVNQYSGLTCRSDRPLAADLVDLDM